MATAFTFSSLACTALILANEQWQPRLRFHYDPTVDALVIRPEGGVVFGVMPDTVGLELQPDGSYGPDIEIALNGPVSAFTPDSTPGPYPTDKVLWVQGSVEFLDMYGYPRARLQHVPYGTPGTGYPSDAVEIAVADYSVGVLLSAADSSLAPVHTAIKAQGLRVYPFQ